MDSYERFYVPSDYEDERVKEAREISVNELFEKKERLYRDLERAVRLFEDETGVGVKSVTLNEHIFDIQLDI